MRLFLKSKAEKALSRLSEWLHQWGQGLVEFALMLPVLLMILFVLVEAAFVIQGYLAVQHAAREAARWAVSYRPVQGQSIDEEYCTNTGAGDSVAAFLFTDADLKENCDPNENDNEWYARRVALIKETAIQRAAGLRIKQEAYGLTDTDFAANQGTAGFFGVRVSGNDWYGNMLSDFPGLPGLPVQVEVVHRVELVDPFLRIVAPNGIRVRGRANMVNEGVQVWQPSPTPYTSTPSDFTPPPTPIGGNTPTPTYTPTPLPTSTPTSGGYCLDIPFDTVTNTLPFQRGHAVPVTVVDCVSLERVPNVIVSFSIDELGSYSYSGEPAGNQYAEDTTGSTGVARRTIYANRPTTTTVRAWWDQDGDNTWDAGEPTDSATKIWRLPTDEPYILASTYEVLPLQWMSADIYNHPPLQEPFTLLWCRTTITGGIESSMLYTDSIDVDDVDGYALDLAFEVPADSAGYYRLETHSSPAACGNAGTLVAYSADIYILPQPPDLRVTSITYPDTYGDVLPSNEYIPFRVEVENLAPWPVESTLFDVDLYIDPPVTPTLGQIGDGKQWLSDIAGYGTESITIEVRMGPGIHQLWAQVDTTGYVEEQVETNNIFGPVEVEVDCTVDSSDYGDDFEDDVVDGKWSTQNIGSGVNGSVAESGGQLRITARGSTIWGNSDNFFFVYQTVFGNFDVRLRVVSPPANSGAKLGVMIRNSLAANSRHVLLSARDADGRRLQAAYRATDGGSTNYAASELDPSPAPPVWLRIVRSGANFSYYYSDAVQPTSDDWNYLASTTVGMDDAVLVGLAHASYSSSSSLTSRAEEFLVCQGGSDLSEYDAPGLRECTQLFEAGDFEGNPDRVFEYWDAGGSGAFQRTGYQQHGGAFSMRLHASLGSYPACTALDPWVAQTVRLPTEIYTTTYLLVEGYRLVGGSLADCSVLGSVDFDDELYVQVQDGAGNPDVLLWPGGGMTPTLMVQAATLGPGATVTPASEETGTPPPTPTGSPVGPLAPSAPSASSAIIFSADFNNGTDGFSYQDDTFRGTSQPNYASGNWLATGGYGSSGGLQVNVGGLDFSTVYDMSGGWSGAFNLPAAGEVTVTFRYQLTQLANYETDEYSDMMMSVDGVLYGTGANDYVARVVGDGNGGAPRSTGWQLFQVNVGTLSAGNHTLIIGGYNNKKTYNDESTEALIDDVEVDAANIPPTATPTPTQTPTPGPSPTPTQTPTPTPEPPPEEWVYFDADFTGAMDLEALAGQEVAIRFYATHDADEFGTWFYLDDVQCNVCSDWPIPDPVDGTASFGGLVRGMTGAVPQVMTGVRVMAYSRGGQVYRTLSIHDGTYHFYNVPPGSYTIYAEAWAGGFLMVDSATVTVVANERNYGINLLLQ